MRLPRRIRRAIASWVAKAMTLSGVDANRGWLTLWRSGDDTHTGSWQQDARVSLDTALTFSPFYACTTLISSDVGKVRLGLMQEQKGVWLETASPSFSPVLRKPNHYQTRQQFIECWVLSKLLHGNTYVYKVRDNRRIVTALYILPPDRVTPLVSTSGDVFYDLRRDDLSKVPQDIPAIPASEIIHDRMECLFHPLVGIPPLIASALASSQGMRIQRNSEWFFKNMSRPGGMLTAPGHIDDETAGRLKEEFEKNFSGEKMGRLFVGGDDLKFNAMAIPAEQSQLVEQLKLSAEQVCMAFHVPAYMIGAGSPPSYANVEALNQHYYTQCLQKIFNAIEDLLDEGLGLTSSGYRTEFDLDELLRMDARAQIGALKDAVSGSIMAINEARKKIGLPPVKGGDVPLSQQQYWPIDILQDRPPPSDAVAPPAQTEPDEETDAEEQAKFWRGVADIPQFAEACVRSLPPLIQRAAP